MERLAGMLSDADEQLLQSRLKNDPAAKMLWESLEEQNRQLEAGSFLERLDPKAELNGIKIKMNKVPVKRLLHWRNIAAAMFVLIVFGFLASRYFVDPEHMALTASLPVSKKEKDVALVLGDGRSVPILGKKESTTTELEKEASHPALTELNTLLVPTGKDHRIVLSDGTKVWLNSGSKLRFPFLFSGNTREVYLQGEGYFEVSKNKDNPFIVHTENTAIHVLGTKFNVNTYSVVEKTSLVEGRVTLTAPDGSLLKLEPGYQSTYDPARGLGKQAFRDDEVLSWMKGVYYFHNIPLAEIKNVIERWFDVKVILDRPEISRYTISGLLEKEHLNEFLGDLKTTSQIGHSYSGNVLHLK